MIRLSVGLAVVAVWLLAQLPPEPQTGDPVGPFANSGQIIIVIVTIVVNLIQGFYTAWMADRREARKEATALKQRELDDAKTLQQRQWDLEDRRLARQELEQRLETTRAAVVEKLGAARKERGEHPEGESQ